MGGRVFWLKGGGGEKKIVEPSCFFFFLGHQNLIYPKWRKNE